MPIFPLIYLAKGYQLMKEESNSGKGMSTQSKNFRFCAKQKFPVLASVRQVSKRFMPRVIG